MANRTKFTTNARERFINSLRVDANVTKAADAAGISRRCAYDHKDDDPEFSAAWDEAVESALDRAEGELWRRGVDGVDKPVTYQGQITAHYKEYSDTALLALLKARRDAYKDKRQLEHSGPDGGAVKFTFDLGD